MSIEEKNVQKAVSTWLKFQYPNVQFRVDYAAGLRMTIGQAKIQAALQKSRAWPDLFIAEPRGRYAGLFIELKVDWDEVYTKSGSIRQEKHIQEQFKLLQELNKRGYLAQFGCGFGDTIQSIREYLSGDIWAVRTM